MESFNKDLDYFKRKYTRHLGLQVENYTVAGMAKEEDLSVSRSLQQLVSLSIDRIKDTIISCATKTEPIFDQRLCLSPVRKSLQLKLPVRSVAVPTSETCRRSRQEGQPQ